PQDMASTTPSGAARQVNRAILTATFWFGALALLSLLILLPILSAGTSESGIAGIVYGLTLLACSACSYLYNMREESPRRWLLRYLDHGAIFLLIAGTYTPFVVNGVAGPFGISLLIWVWSLALFGIV